MKQFRTALKVKKFEELQIIEKINNINLEIDNLEKNINNIDKNIKNTICNINITDSIQERTSLMSIIENLKECYRLEEHKKYVRTQQVNELNDSLVLKRQEIKSIDYLIEKKLKEAKLLELKKEQDILDELNMADY